jgi:hypothetical protein
MSNPPAVNGVKGRFFEPGGTLSYNSPCYVTREADDTLVSALLAHEYCYLLDSRQKGKSSLMVRTASVLKADGLQTVVLDLQGRGSNVTLDQWYAGMLTRFGDELGIRAELLGFWQAHQHLGPLERFFGAIEELVLPKIEIGLVVFVDEVDFVRSLPFKTDEFFAGIRHFYNRRATDSRFQKLSFVLIGTADPLELIADPNLTPFNIGRRIELQDFKIEECGPLSKGLNENEQIASTLMQRIIYWTSGHPYLTQRLCEVVWDRGAIKAGEVDRIVAQIFLSEEAQTSEPNLFDVKRRVAEGVPVGVEPSDYFGRVRDIYSRLLKGKAVANSQQDPVIASLKLSGLLAVRDSNLVIRTRIYKHIFGPLWLEELRSLAEDVDQAQQGFLTPAVRAKRTKNIKVTAVSVAVVLAAIFCVYRVMWSVGQPTFTLDTEAVYPGQTILLKGNHLSGAEAMLSDDVGHESSIAIEQDAKSASAIYPFSVHVPKSVPPGHYALRVSRAPFLGFLSFGWSTEAARVTIADDRPLALTGHKDIVTSASFSPDGNHIITSSGDGTVRIWDAKNEADFDELSGHKAYVLDARYSHDGKRIVSASFDRTAVIWDATTGKQLVRLVGHKDKVYRASFSPDGTKVLTASDDRTAIIWDAKTGKELVQLKGHKARVMGEDFSPDGSKVATASFDGTVRIWAAASGKQLLEIPASKSFVFFVSFSPDGSRIVTAAQDNVATVWDATSGKQLLKLVGHKDWVVFAGFSPDGKRIITSSKDKTARVWNAATAKPLFELLGHNGRVNTAYFSPDGTRIVTACLEDKSARVWDAKTGKPLTRPLQ